jgi:hypothetical protein
MTTHAKKTRSVKRLALWSVAALAALVPTLGYGQAESNASQPWSVVTTFAPDGIKCVLRFSAAKDGPSLSLENRRPDGGGAATAFFNLTGLPPLLKANKSVVKDVQIGVGSTWSAKVDANWFAKGPGTGGRLTLTAAPDITTVLKPIATGSALTISLATDDGAKSFDFTLTGSAAAIDSFNECLARAGTSVAKAKPQAGTPPKNADGL